ncbi:MAG: protein TolR [Alphaproteobacteria bacterium]|nr:protein TolR [Alphaproteobacteria bacterium]
MGFSTGGNPRTKSTRRKAHIVAEINVTPMVDVMLVLLIIFMVTAPLLTVGVPVDLPKTNASAMGEQDKPLTVTVDSNGTIYLQETPLELTVLVPRLVAITGSNPEARIYVRGDKGISYGQVMEVMGAINAAGFKKVALISELPQGKAPPTPQAKTGK